MATNKTSIILTADDRTRAAFTSAKANMQGLQQAGVKLTGILSGIGLGVGASAAGLRYARQPMEQDEGRPGLADAARRARWWRRRHGRTRAWP